MPNSFLCPAEVLSREYVNILKKYGLFLPFCAKNLQGDILYPLNELKEKYPNIYKQQMSKYIGREYITARRIPILNCLWNDVLHLSAVNPKELKQTLIHVGRDPHFLWNCYQIKQELIDPKDTVVYLYQYKDSKYTMDKRNFIPYVASKIKEFSAMPQATKKYYEEVILRGERPLLHHHIPHILYRGTLNVEKLPIISV